MITQGLNFELKVFHPQNCVYSMIADVKRQAQAALPDEVTEQQALAVKATISALSTEWLVLSEQHLCTLQVNIGNCNILIIFTLFAVVYRCV